MLAYRVLKWHGRGVRSLHIVFSDGASRGNPGIGGCGAVLVDASGAVVATAKQFLGDNITNNAAEYHGLLLALDLAKEHAIESVEVQMDSELVTKQMLGVYRVKHPVLQTLHQQAKAKASALPRVQYRAIPRAANAVADQLANDAIDTRPSSTSS
ncbi:ribonuclease HI [Saprolegnia parasitica CBS 223.65]|uniref:Ribonuclease HI n=1 Tax=Saprolegnia parasitica (strain CBS 223.65) TaxID=695850 RepID=A0A067C5G2_SAPPC|nr:ribonuclease HI [Saprolegnia parasitica CBS 223.65]KDO24385.1 ribonuclease HI [Saprolegnia parasitica CBS 223.65]|eukprot:XP_012204991.1 ribonuclease HI [Saprolegnia parasitica CBS 223.65]